MIAEHLDGPLLVVLDCLKEWRLVSELYFFEEYLTFLFDEQLSQLLIIVDDGLAERRLSMI